METENVKVYELAKELGLDSMSLLDKLKTLNIPVKSHMSELGPGELKVVRESLTQKPAAEPKKKATTVTRKKAAAPAPTDGEAPAPVKAKTKSPTKAAAASTDSATASQTPSASAKGSSIIRRRTKADGGTETVVGGTTSKAAETASFESESSTPAETHEQQESTESTETTAIEETTSTPSLTAGPAVTEEKPSTPEAPKTRAPVVFNRPVAPRKSFLTIVEAQAPPPRPIIKPPASTKPVIKKPGETAAHGTAKDGFRIIKMDKANLDQMAEEEAAKKRGGGREAEIKPEDVRFADYRKKEMVFLPKKKRLPIGKEIKRTTLTTPKAIKRIVEMGDSITVQELAAQLNVKAGDVIKKLMTMGQMATMNQALDFDTAVLVASEYQFEVKNIAFKEEVVLNAPTDADEHLVPRPPVVTIMGHVDHGKTSLLDAIREANVAGGEAGGITQHIGAYTVEKDGKQITFIDTPGHEAFTAMRLRGANATDIVILVVAADDGVMPQTREALSHAQAAGVPIIVAVNKIDKPGANPEKIKQGLAELNLLAEDWGGQTMFVPVSALKKTNLDKLLESILLQAEVLELKANPNTEASGNVLEARLEKGRGPVASVLVKRGTLKVGDIVVSGTSVGKIKAMMNDKGEGVRTVGPGIATEILGLESPPQAGDNFNVVADDATARKIAETRSDKAKAKLSPTAGKTSLEDLFSKIQAGTVKELNVVLKADVFGSVEAVRDSLIKLSTEKVKVKVIMAAAGGISESDVLLASASGAVIIGFGVRPETKAMKTAEAEHVEIKTYSIIYELLDDIKKAMAGLLDKKKVERFLGRAEVRQVFSVPKIGTIAGSSVVDGKIIRGANVRLLRESRIIYEGKMTSLKRFKDDAKEVQSGYECGIGLENYNDLKVGDLIEAYQIDLISPELDA